MINKSMLFSAVKDMFLNDSYDEYSIGNGYTVVRNGDVEDWEDEGFTVKENGEEVTTASAGAMVANRDSFVFDLGGCLKFMVDSVAEEIGYEGYEHIADEYYAHDLLQAIDDDEVSEEEAVTIALDEIASILSEWDDDEYSKEDWEGVAMPALLEYMDVISDRCGMPLPTWIKDDILEIQKRWEVK